MKRQLQSRISWRLGVVAVQLFCAAIVAADPPSNWPNFRGPGFGQLTAGAGDPPAQIDLTRDTRFRVKIPAGGRSSPIIWGDRIYLTGEGGHIMAFDRATGELKWDTILKMSAPAAPPDKNDADNPVDPETNAGEAAPTPVTDGKYVYAFFGDGSFACVDTDGKQIWARRLIPKPDNAFGLASSPLLCGDLLIQVVDQGDDADAKASFIVAMRPGDGTEVWRKDRPVASSWASPIIAHSPEGEMLITTANHLAIAYNPKTGDEYWRADGSPLENSVSPTQISESAVAMPGDDFHALKLLGKGDVTKTGNLWTADIANAIPSPVADKSRCYIVGAGSDLTCVDSTTGKEIWTLELGGTIWASPILANGRIYAIDKTGKISVVSTEGKKLAEANLADSVNASPAVLDGRIYIRTGSELICIGKP